MPSLKAPIRSASPHLSPLAAVALLAAVAGPAAGPAAAQSTDLYLEGADARAMAVGGATTADPTSPLAALAYNPAGLAGPEGWRVSGSLTGGLVNGEHDNRVATGSGIGQRVGAIGSFGVSWARGDVGAGFAAQPINAWLADWEYPDVPGTAGAQYPDADQRALFLNYRFGVGAAVRVAERLTVGVSGGLVYNRNELDAPYVFQSQPALQGVKVDIDLVTSTFAPNVNVGLLFDASDAIRLGLSWTSGTSFESDGELTGNADAQFEALGLGGAPADLGYDAEVETGLPQMVSLGVAMDASERLALHGQLDWVDWSAAFRSLVVNLENGTNAAVNGLVGDDALTDDGPLRWESRFVTRLGLTYAIDSDLAGRLGLSHGKSPARDETLTPLSGPITETTLSAGLGWALGPWDAEAAYQWELPAERSVGTSSLLAGEYSDSRTEVSIHRLTLSVSRRF